VQGDNILLANSSQVLIFGELIRIIGGVQPTVDWAQSCKSSAADRGQRSKAPLEPATHILKPEVALQ
jgi:hypothetical protein